MLTRAKTVVDLLRFCLKTLGFHADLNETNHMRTVTERRPPTRVTGLGAFGDHGTAPIVMKICTRLVY